MLLGLLYAQAEARPGHTAIVYRDERIALAELLERIERLASGLALRGIAPGDAVALVLRDDPWFVACFHAITALGAMVVPVNPAFKRDELEFCFRSAERRGGDQRRARRWRLRAARRPPRRDRCDQHDSAHGQADRSRRWSKKALAERLPARVRHGDVRVPVLLRLDRPAQARAAHARAVSWPRPACTSPSA